MKNYIKIFSAIIFALVLFSCEREIDLEIEGAGDTIILDGQIFEGEFPFLTVSRTFSFYDELTFQDAANLFIADADIQISVDGVSIDMVEESFYLEEDSITLITFYIPDFEDPNAFNFIGERGKTYSISGTVGDKTFSSSTYIPNQTPIDSIWYEPHPKPEEFPDLVLVYVRASDADTLGNYYQIYTQRNDEPFYKEDNSIFEDTVINGTSYDVPVARAPEPFTDNEDFDTYGYFSKGDELITRRCAIDESVYDFYASMEYIASGSGGPFGSATVLKTNIKGEGFTGVWAGYSVEDIGIVVPE